MSMALNSYKERWQTALAAAHGSRLQAGAQTAGSLAEGFLAGYQLAMSRTLPLDRPDWTALAVSEGFNDLPAVTRDGEGALTGSKTWIPAVVDMDALIVRVGRGSDAMFLWIDLPHPACASELRPKEGFLDDLGLGMMHFDQLPPSGYRALEPFPVRSFPLMEATSFFAILLLASERLGLKLSASTLEVAYAMGQASPLDIEVEEAKTFVANTANWLRSNDEAMRQSFEGWDQDQRLVSMYAQLGA